MADVFLRYYLNSDSSLIHQNRLCYASCRLILLALIRSTCLSVCLSVCMSVRPSVRPSVYPHNNLKTITDICFLFASYVDCRKILNRVRTLRSQVKVKVIFQRVQGHSVRLSAVSVADSEIQSPVALFSS